AGDVKVDTRALTMTGGARIDSSTSGTGRGGRLAVTASDFGTMGGANGGLFSTASSQDARARAAGAIAGGAAKLTLRDRARTSAATTGPGNAGDIKIDTGPLALTGGSRIDSSTSGTGRGGSLAVTATEFTTINGENSGLFNTAS